MHFAICIWGLLRSLPLTYENVNEMIFKPLAYYNHTFDIFMHTYSLEKKLDLNKDEDYKFFFDEKNRDYFDSDPASSESKEDLPYTNSRSNEFNITTNFSEFSSLFNTSYVFIENQSNFDARVLKNKKVFDQFTINGDPWSNNYSSLMNHIRALNSLNYLSNLVEIVHKDLDIHYDNIIYFRPDVFFLDSLPISLVDRRVQDILLNYVSEESEVNNNDASSKYEYENLGNLSFLSNFTAKASGIDKQQNSYINNSFVNRPMNFYDGVNIMNEIKNQKLLDYFKENFSFLNEEPEDLLLNNTNIQNILNSNQTKSSLDNFKIHSEFIFTPSFHRSCFGTELNDRFAIASYKSGLLYGRRFEYALEYTQHFELHSETYTLDFFKYLQNDFHFFHNDVIDKSEASLFHENHIIKDGIKLNEIIYSNGVNYLENKTKSILKSASHNNSFNNFVMQKPLLFLVEIPITFRRVRSNGEFALRDTELVSSLDLQPYISQGFIDYKYPNMDSFSSSLLNTMSYTYNTILKYFSFYSTNDYHKDIYNNRKLQSDSQKNSGSLLNHAFDIFMVYLENIIRNVYDENLLKFHDPSNLWCHPNNFINYNLLFDLDLIYKYKYRSYKRLLSDKPQIETKINNSDHSKSINSFEDAKSSSIESNSVQFLSKNKIKCENHLEFKGSSSKKMMLMVPKKCYFV